MGGRSAGARSGLAGWVEFALLRRSLNRRIGSTGVAPLVMTKLWIAAGLAAAAGWALRGTWDIVVLAAFGLVYLGATSALQVTEGVFDFLLRLRSRNR